MRLFIFLTLITLYGCGHKVKSTPPVAELRVTENNPNKLTALTKQNVFQLVQIYDLEPFLYTKEIVIQTGVIPHSHPILTLNTKYADQPMKILASILHEEFHWWVDKNPQSLRKTVLELSKMYPGRDRNSYHHLVICLLEYKALIKYLGRKNANQVIRTFMLRENIYPWVYTQIQANETKFVAMVKKNKLYPAGL